MLQGKTIVLGVSGGIAAYKAATLCSCLKQAGADVHVMMTKSAIEFISPLTFQTLSCQPVHTDTFVNDHPAVISHIDLADRADVILIAPATANVIAKIAHGLADDMLTTTLLATRAPIMVAPAMNVHMYTNISVRHNMDILRQYGVQCIEPEEGFLACGYIGKGRMAAPDHIIGQVGQLFVTNNQHKQVNDLTWLDKSLLRNKTVLVTAGATIERIDPVRYITNDSSGKMGFAIAEVARNMGANVIVIAGQTQACPPKGVTVVHALSAQSMYDEVINRYEKVDLVIKTAAVADYRPVKQALQKIKKTAQRFTMELERNPDIIAALGRQKKHQFLIGFAAETEQIEKYALDKLQRKQLDLIVVNDVSRSDIGFGSDHNEVSIFDSQGLVEHISVTSKHVVAKRILQLAAERLQDHVTHVQSNSEEVHFNE